MTSATNLAAVVTAIAGLFTSIGILPHEAAGASPAFSAAQENPTITITHEGTYFTFSPERLEVNVGQPITVINEDPRGVHSVTERKRSFFVDVEPNSSATLTVSDAGSYQYFCDWHFDMHDPLYGSLKVS